MAQRADQRVDFAHGLEGGEGRTHQTFGMSAQRFVDERRAV